MFSLIAESGPGGMGVHCGQPGPLPVHGAGRAAVHHPPGQLHHLRVRPEHSQPIPPIAAATATCSTTATTSATLFRYIMCREVEILKNRFV